jgi:hypothetical protein
MQKGLDALFACISMPLYSRRSVMGKVIHPNRPDSPDSPDSQNGGGADPRLGA